MPESLPLTEAITKTYDQFIFTDPQPSDGPKYTESRLQRLETLQRVMDRYLFPIVKEAYESKGHLGPFSKDILCAIHYMCVQGTQGNLQERFIDAGKFRDKEVYTGGKERFAHPQSDNLDALFEQWTKKLDELLPKITQNNLSEFVGWVSESLITLHPFEDGNGRAVQAFTIFLKNLVNEKYNIPGQKLLGPLSLKTAMHKSGLKGGIYQFHLTRDPASIKYLTTQDGHDYYCLTDPFEFINAARLEDLSFYKVIGEAYEVAQEIESKNYKKASRFDSWPDVILRSLQTQTKPFLNLQ